MRNTSSHSQISSYLSCQQKWYNLYVRNLSSKSGKPWEMTLGIAGHAWLAEYYKSLKETCGTNRPSVLEKAKAISNANSVFVEMQRKGSVDSWIITELTQILPLYVNQPVPYTFEIISVEKKYGDVLLSKDQEYVKEDPGNHFVVMITDLVIKALDGQYVGKIGVWDHKFSNNFPDESLVLMNPQIIKQIHTLRSNGIHAEFGALNYIRYRKMDRTKNQVFSRFYVPVSDTRINNVMNEHRKIAEQLVYLKSIKPEDSLALVVKNLSYECKSCEFLKICNDELNGVDPKETIEAFYNSK